MYTGYLVYGGVELANNQRVVSYLNGAPFLGIPGLRQPSTVVSASCGCASTELYCDTGSGVDGAYLSPTLDNAPWYDIDEPDSAEFAGFFVEEVTGFDSTIRREFSDGAISGSSLGPLKMGGRSLTVTGWLMAQTCCGAEYGLQWLQSALMGSGDCDGCGFADLFMIKCCPPEGDTCYRSEVAVVETTPGVNSTFTVTNGGAGIYTFVVNDALRSDLVSTAAGAANNVLGGIPVNYAATQSFRFVVSDATGATFTFYIPFAAITAFATANSGVGAQATFTVDTNTTGDCDDLVRDIGRLVGQISTFQASYASGVPATVETPTQVRGYTYTNGINVNDYARLLHRVGVIDGPKVIERRGSCCTNNCGCTNIKVQFTIASELPYIFSDIEWCLEEEPFDFLDEYCLDLRSTCSSCATTGLTKTVERQVARTRRDVTLFSDQTWCPEGWDKTLLGCPPDGSYLHVGTVQANTVTAGTSTPALINLQSGGVWEEWPSGTWDAADAFPPVAGTLELAYPGDCTIAGVDFLPGDAASRQAMMAFLYRAYGSPAFIPPGTPSFTDVPTTNPFYLEIEWAVSVSIATGSGGAFSPANGATRQAVAAWMYRNAGSPAFVPPAFATFSDVAPADPFYLEIEWCANQGIMDGYGDGTFRPLTITTRQAAMAIIYRAYGSPAFIPPGTPTFSDVSIANPFYLEIEWAADQGIALGSDNPDSTTEATPCLVRIIYNAATGSRSWEPIRWSGDLDAAFAGDECACLAIGETSIVNAEACQTAEACPIDVSCGNSYGPDLLLSRQAAASFLYQMNGAPAFVPPTSPTFTDVSLNNTFYLEIEWVNFAGLMTGYGDGTFRPETAMSRQAMMVVLYRQAGSPAFVPPVIPTFTDVPTTHAFYLEIEWAYSTGIATGYGDGTFRPDDGTTRWAAAVFIYRSYGSPAFIPPTSPTFIDIVTTESYYLEVEWLFAEDITDGFAGQTRWTPIGWDYSPGDTFPPAGCNIVIETVEGSPINMDPVTEEIEVAYDEFVPDCGSFPVPPPAPIVIGAQCYCEPWNQVRQCCTFTNPSDWSDSTSYIEIWTGSEELHKMKISAYDNPFGEQIPCPCDPADDFWVCRTPCSTLLIPQLPERARLIIDSRQRTAQLVLSSGRVVNAMRYIYADDGGPFEWFDIGSCSTFCIVVQVDSNRVAADATVSIGSVGRFAASGG